MSSGLLQAFSGHRNVSKFCNYHQDVVPSTDKSKDLRRFTHKLILEDNLKEYIAHHR